MRFSWLILGLLPLYACSSKDEVREEEAEEESVGEDKDADGYPTPYDCDDTFGSVNPGAEEVPDGLDNDCDGEIDEVDPEDGVGADDCEGTVVTVFIDYDFDGFGTDLFEREACLTEAGVLVDGAGAALEGWVENDDDCDDKAGRG